MGRFFYESRYAYGHGELLLKAFEVQLTGGELILNVHDILAWVNPNQLEEYCFAPADIPIAIRLTEGS